MVNGNGNNVHEDLNSLVQLTLRKVDIHTILYVLRTNRNIQGEMIDNVYCVKRILLNALMPKAERIEKANG